MRSQSHTLVDSDTENEPIVPSTPRSRNQISQETRRLKNQITKLKRKNQEQESEINQLKRDIKTNNATIRKLREEHQKGTKKMEKEKRLRIKSNREKYEILTQKMYQLERKVMERLNALTSMEDIGNALDEGYDALQTLINELQTLNREKEEWIETNDQMEQDFNVHMDDLQSLQEHINHEHELEDSNALLHEENEQLKADLITLRDEFLKMNSIHMADVQLQHERDEQVSSINQSHEDEMNDIHSQLDLKNEMIQNLERRRREDDDRIRRLKTQTDQLINENEQLHADLMEKKRLIKKFSLGSSGGSPFSGDDGYPSSYGDAISKSKSKSEWMHKVKNLESEVMNRDLQITHLEAQNARLEARLRELSEHAQHITSNYETHAQNIRLSRQKSQFHKKMLEEAPSSSVCCSINFGGSAGTPQQNTEKRRSNDYSSRKLLQDNDF